VRILFLTQYYPPETGAAQNRLRDLAQRLAAYGHHISVMTALPSYPHGRIFAGYRRKIFQERWEGPIRVIRAWCYATKSPGFLRRLANYFSFVVTSLFFAGWKIPNQDVVIVESPPLFLGIPALALSRLKGAQLVTNVADLWPESAIALGIVERGTISRWAVKFEEYLYRKSAIITGQSSAIVGDIAKRMHGRRVIFLPNGTSPEALLSAGEKRRARSEMRGQWRIAEEFVVGYTGLHGLAQDLETVLEAAAILRAEPRIRVVMMGDGPEKQRLMSLARNLGLTNVSFYPSHPAAAMGRILAALDVALVPLKKIPILLGVLPAKLLEAMGAAVPVIVSGGGEPAEVVRQASAGAYVEPENPAALAETILRLFRNPQLCRTFGTNGSRYALQNFNRASIAHAWHLALTTEIAPAGSRQG
jgi:glycosyltransferase involved in cell wall biosynthesis